MIGLVHPRWRTAVVVHDHTELRAAAARYQRAQQEHFAAPSVVERAPRPGEYGSADAATRRNAGAHGGRGAARR
jgi:hypothetical protein